MIVDSNSTDDTLAIAGRFPNVRTVQRPFDTRGNGASPSRCGVTSDWVLRLDADYMVEPALRDEIAALAPAAGTTAALRDRLRLLHRRPAVAGLALPLPVLFRRGRGKFVQDGHTEKLSIDGPIVKLASRLLHGDRKSLERWLQSQSRYQRRRKAPRPAVVRAELARPPAPHALPGADRRCRAACS